MPEKNMGNGYGGKERLYGEKLNNVGIRRHNFGKGNIEDNAKLILDQILNDVRRQKNSKR